MNPKDDKKLKDQIAAAIEKAVKKGIYKTNQQVDFGFCHKDDKEHEDMILVCGVLSELSIMGVCQLHDDLLSYAGWIKYRVISWNRAAMPDEEDCVAAALNPENPNRKHLGDGTPKTLLRAGKLAFQALNGNIMDLKDHRYDKAFERIDGGAGKSGQSAAG